MAEPSKPTASETDLALIAFAQVVLDLLYAAEVIEPRSLNRLLDVQIQRMQLGEFPIAAGILGAIQEFANSPELQRQIEETRKLLRERPKGSA